MRKSSVCECNSSSGGREMRASSTRRVTSRGGGSSSRRATMTSLLATLMTYGAVTSLAAPAAAPRGVVCVHGNVTYAGGQLYRRDACTTCRCGAGRGGRPRCVVEDCTPSTNCRRTVTPTTDADRCCSAASCHDETPGCIHNGRLYAAGQVRLRSGFSAAN